MKTRSSFHAKLDRKAVVNSENDLKVPLRLRKQMAGLCYEDAKTP